MHILTHVAVFFSLLLFHNGTVLQGQVLINEFMASNGQTIIDEDGDYSDWLELYNAGAEVVHLNGYGLSDNTSNPYKWVFPDVAMEPGAFLLIWASGKNHHTPTGALHTNWSISAEGEDLVLTDATGNTLDMISAVAVPRDLSYGRAPDGGSSFNIYDKPTPGKSNGGKGYLGILEPPHLTYTQLGHDSWQIELSHPDPEVELYYSINGADPIGRGSLYHDEVILDDWLDDSLRYIRTVPIEADPAQYGWIPPEGAFPSLRVVRYTAHKSGYLPPPVQARTLNLDATTMPVISITMDPMDLFDDSIGIYVPGRIYQEHGFNFGEFWGSPNANYFQRGPEWERTASMEWLYPDSTRHQMQVRLRIHGNSSRALPQKSLRVYAHSNYGRSEFQMDLLQNGIQGYRQFLLRNSGQDGLWQATLLRDATLHQVVAHFNLETQDYLPALVYINGEFWGIHNMRERYSDDYLALKYGLDPNRIDYLNNNQEINYGTADHFEEVLDFMTHHSLAEDEHYHDLTTRIDPENLADYYIAQVYTANYDWPGNNLDYWRLRTDTYHPESPYGQDGRWRWSIIDLDYSFGMNWQAGYHYNMLEHMTQEGGQGWPNPDWSTFIPRKMFESGLFRTYFINRFCDQLNTGLHPDRVEALIQSNAERLQPFIPLHIQRWGRPVDLLTWFTNIEGMLFFAENRPDRVRQHLQTFFQLEDPLAINLQVSDPSHGHIRINTVAIHPATPGVEAQPYPWTGLYFQGMPITLEAKPAAGYRFVRWEGLEEEMAMDNPVTVAWEESMVMVLAVFEEEDPGSGLVMHYWHFNDLPSGTLTAIPADVSLVPGGLITYPGTGDGYMDRVNDGTDLYALSGHEGGLGLRVRNPADTRELIFHVPTTGYKDIRMHYAANRTNNGATLQAVYYSSAAIPDWELWEVDIPVGAEYQSYSFDFSDIEAVSDNPDFAIRIVFEGAAASNTSGNNRFDNILLVGDKIVPVTSPDQADLNLKIFPNPATDQLFLEWYQSGEGDVRMQVSDLLGRPVFEQIFSNSGFGKFVDLIDVQHLTTGIYIVTITDSQGHRASRRLIKN